MGELVFIRKERWESVVYTTLVAILMYGWGTFRDRDENDLMMDFEMNIL